MSTATQSFSHMARYYDAIYRAKGKDYRAEADYLHRVIRERNPAARTLLDAACGTAEHLLHLSAHYTVAGFDASPTMLEVARAKLPGVRLDAADLTRPAVAGRFDAVTCLFAAIAYLPDRAALRTSVAALARRLHPAGLLLIEPGVMPVNLTPPRTSTLTAAADGVTIERITSAELLNDDGSRGGRPTAIRITFEHTVTPADHPAPPTRFSERHTLQLFSRADYEAAFDAAGLQCEVDPVGPAGMGLFIGRA